MGRTKRYRVEAQCPMDSPLLTPVCMLPPQRSPSSTTCNGAQVKNVRSLPLVTGTSSLTLLRAVTRPRRGLRSVSSEMPLYVLYVRYVFRQMYHSRTQHYLHSNAQADRGFLTMTRVLASIAEQHQHPWIFGPIHGWPHSPGCPDLVYGYPCSIWAPSQLHRCL
ncbi:hypothetical protein VTI28DRAFT_1816 [Corynascus sepedonium]